MSARDSTEEEAIQELSELNLRAHTQSVGLTGYDPFERLWNPNPNKSEMKKSDATLKVNAKLTPLAMNDDADPVHNPPNALPESREPTHLLLQHPSTRLDTTNQGEDIQAIRMIVSDDRMLVDEDDTEDLGQDEAMPSDRVLALQATIFRDMDGNKASLRSFCTNEQGTEKKKTVAEFFREHLSTSHSTNTLQRNDWEKPAFRPKEVENKKGSTWSRPIGGMTNAQEEPKMFDTKQNKATRGRRPTANSRSSLSMLVFATWSLLTWKTAIAPTGLWGASTNSFLFSSVSCHRQLVWKTTNGEEKSRVFPNLLPLDIED